MAGIRISVVTHHHVPVEWNKEDGFPSIGAIINDAIRQYIDDGQPIQTVAFEMDVNDHDEQARIREIYKNTATASVAVADDEPPSYRKPPIKKHAY